MSGIGIGRFARRKTAAEKTPQDVSKGAPATATRRIIPPRSTAAANATGNSAESNPSSGRENNTAWDDLSDGGGFHHRDDFSFSDHGGGNGGSGGFFLFDDDNSIGSSRSIVDHSFDLGHDGFHDGASFGDGCGSDFGTERKTDASTPGTSVAKPNGTFGFSRFAKKNESKSNVVTALNTDGGMDPNKGSNDESNALNPIGKGEPVSIVNKTGGSNRNSNNNNDSGDGGDGSSNSNNNSNNNNSSNSSSSSSNQDHQTSRNSNEASSIATRPAPSQTIFSAVSGNPLSRHADPAPREESRRVSLDNHHTYSDARTDRPDPTSRTAEPSEVLQPQNKRQKQQEQQEQRSIRPSSSFPASVHVLDSVHQPRKHMQQTSNEGETPRATEKPVAIVPTNTSVGYDDNSAICSDSGKKPGIISRIDHSSNASRGTSESSRRVSTGNEGEAGRNQIRNQQKQKRHQGQNQNQYRRQYQYQYQYQKHQEPTPLHARVRDSNQMQKPVPLVAAVTPTPPVVPARDSRSNDAENHTARSKSSSNIVPRPNTGRATAVAGTMHGASQNQSGCDRNVRNGMATGSHNKEDNVSVNHNNRVPPGTENDKLAIDNGPRPETLGDNDGNIGSEMDRSDQQMKNTNEDEDAFEFRQAKFLADIRETEDIQDLIEADLRTANHRFAEHYALLLRDLDAAVDLLDKLEAIEEAAEDVLARYSCDESSFFGCNGEHAITNENVGSVVAD